VSADLPAGFTVGHWTDREGGTGCTVVLAPEPGAVASGEVRGGGPGTRETDLLAPSSGARDVQAIAFCGGSAYGLAAADGVTRWLAERGRGYETRTGSIVPLVPAAVVFDLPFGRDDAWPDAAAGAAACDAATAQVERGSVGAGTGCAVGKVLGPEHWVKGGIGLATDVVQGVRITALAVVNALGDVLAEDGSILAGPGTTALLREMTEPPHIGAREATTLVCVMTDARLDKTEAWLMSRAASTGIGRAVDPAHTSSDGDAAFVLASGQQDAPDPLVLAAVIPHVVAAAIRDGVRCA
jgi:L-aminopeptidase/D-esterase-like protein